MLKFSYIVVFLFSVTLLSAQNKMDYQWIMGLDNLVDEGIEGYKFDFNQDYFEVVPIISGLEFDGNNAIISDYDGDLLFYSNGCAIANREHQIMPNGHDINEGDFFDILWSGDCSLGYPGSQDILALPDPYNQEGFYLVTKPITYNSSDGSIHNSIFQYSYIDMSLEGGLGDVTIKNEIIYDQDTIQSSYLQAVKHSNGIDWWIIQPSDESNRYLFFLIDNNGLNFHHVQEIGPNFHYNASAGGKAKFSPDGSKFAYYNRHMQLLLYDFDRSSGELSNLHEMYIDSIPFFNAIEFSASGQFLYLGLRKKMYQLDVENIGDADALVLIDEWNGVLDPVETSFLLLQRGPDCRIYVCSGSSTKSYSVINNPDEKGIACDFVQQGIQLPWFSGRASFPNFPNFRIDEEEVCDPTLTSVFGLPIEILNELQIVPNPASGFIDLSFSSNYSARKIELYNIHGQLVIQKTYTTDQLDVSFLHHGIYILKLELDDGKVMVERFVKG